MSRHEFTPEAVEDLNDIHDYIAQDSPSAAARFIREIEEKCDTLAEHPMMGRSRSELTPELRSFPAGSYAIFYRPTEGGVQILRVIHQARDITTMF